MAENVTIRNYYLMISIVSMSKILLLYVS